MTSPSRVPSGSYASRTRCAGRWAGSRQEGFTVNDEKSILATRAGCQRVCVVVVNERLNLQRREYDVLKAILHNATMHGPASQNREARPDLRAHRLGRISWVASLNAARGEKLRHQFAQIAWHDARSAR